MSLLTEAQTAAILSLNPGHAITSDRVIYTAVEIARCKPCKRAHRVDRECTGPYERRVVELITLGVVPAGQVLELIRNEQTAPGLEAESR